MALRICVTGAAGQVGRVISRAAVNKGHTVFGVDLPPGPCPDSADSQRGSYSYQQLDVCDIGGLRRYVEENKCDAMVHMAAVLNNPNRTIKGKEWTESDIHTINTTMSYNILRVSADLGIKRVVQASSVNAIGMLGSDPPIFDYFPLDEKHPFRPQAAYDLSKQICEVQADAFARKYPDMRIASMRYHWVVEPSLLSADALHRRGGEPKGLWGYISEADTAEATLLGLTVPEQTFPTGHEAFFIVAPTQHQQASTAALIDQWYPHSTRRKQWRGNEGLYDCSKAENLLGWTAKISFPWTGPSS